MSGVHPSAVIENGAVIGDGCVIGPFCLVGPDVVLGQGVVLKSHVVVTGDTDIGDETVVFPFAVIGEIPQDLKFERRENAPAHRQTQPHPRACDDEHRHGWRWWRDPRWR